MNNKFIITSLATIALGTTGFFMTRSMDNSSLTPTQLSNIEALSDGEIVVVGCKRQDGSTCYVFSDGNLIDKRKNQYPGN